LCRHLRNVLLAVAESLVLSGSIALAGCSKTNAPIEVADPRNGEPVPAIPDVPDDAPEAVRFTMSCNIERINGQGTSTQPLAVRRSDPLTVAGWVVDETNPPSPPPHLFVVLDSRTTDDEWYAAVSSRLPREDVRRTLNAPILSGFDAVVGIGRVPAGEYRLLLTFWDRGPMQFCDVGRRVVVQ
jgi:hypothetical protein